MALRSVSMQERRPDRLVLSLPRRSEREGCDYVIPSELQEILSEHPWMEVHWLDKDYGPGTKAIGALLWIEANIGQTGGDDVLMVLDDDHTYLPFALGDMLQEQLQRGAASTCSFFSYFFRGIMVPQGADITAMQLSENFVDDMLEFHRAFIEGDKACFLVDDLWLAMYMHLCGRSVVSLRSVVTRRGFEMIYQRNENSKVEALEALQGEDRRDRVSIRAFDSLLARLAKASPEELKRWGGAAAAARIDKLNAEVHQVERQIAEIGAWLDRERRDHDGEAVMPPHAQGAQQQLQKLLHLYRMQVPGSRHAS